jgi:hypothetical protein
MIVMGKRLKYLVKWKNRAPKQHVKPEFHTHTHTHTHTGRGVGEVMDLHHVTF